MSGDVFGNGMLRERTIKLVAAFDHRDIFIDPDPGPGAQLRRAPAPVRSAALELAGLRQGLISAGGGIFSRSAKEIPLSDEARTLLGLDGDEG